MTLPIIEQLPAGTSDDQSDWLSVTDEHGASIVEADAVGNFFWNLLVASASFAVRDYSGVRRIYIDHETDTEIQPPHGGAVMIGATGGEHAVYVTDGGAVLLLGLPTTDPGRAHQVWNDGGTLKLSAG